MQKCVFRVYFHRVLCEFMDKPDTPSCHSSAPPPDNLGKKLPKSTLLHTQLTNTIGRYREKQNRISQQAVLGKSSRIKTGKK